MYYPCGENKGADQLCSYCTADLRLCFRICKLLVFSCTGSIKLGFSDKKLRTVFFLSSSHPCTSSLYLFRPCTCLQIPVPSVFVCPLYPLDGHWGAQILVSEDKIKHVYNYINHNTTNIKLKYIHLLPTTP